MTNESASLTIEVAGTTEIGCVRRKNEDAFGIWTIDHPRRGWLLLVADGIGGVAGGEIASRMAADTVRQSFADAVSESPADALRKAIEDGNRAIHAEATADLRYSEMGTTCTAVFATASEAWVAHVGDTRAYLLRGGEISQITRDHNLAAEEPPKSTRDRSGASNVLTRCLGIESDVQVDVTETPVSLEPESVLVLCSDGINKVIEDAEIHRLASLHLPEGAVKRLVALALERGGPDNTTIIVARVCTVS